MLAAPTTLPFSYHGLWLLFEISLPRGRNGITIAAGWLTLSDYGYSAYRSFFSSGFMYCTLHTCSKFKSLPSILGSRKQENKSVKLS